MNSILLVASGGAIGSVARYLVGVLMTRIFGVAFPWGTLTVNVAGGLLMGLFIELLARRFNGSTELRLFVAVGIMGGFTTFSSFSLDVALLWNRGEAFFTLIYVLASVILSIGALFFGLWLARAVA
ncbi:fluoride efflux transporter CrcB [Phyllobacterium myrsinacearum]|uniref:Fluoride-specific ion channel FluC n=1 Tax=Phyllobacterium myrsinacearum TaxID=28101 RepID=A0A2S9JYR8_9HYPH|nr:fluoride efflux transporter CrcB [Phyllobacterium myrsinacearum]PRD58480.1 fluoride efflux transporter CrcB [Phyllobacterium myrsinacearum]PWV96717.1 camphor resistance protein CrcB [Phyllobacterium myrsinacearum]RZV09291.1 camphor resistance protein CrcB [Phyllobacterium myrsinacearum]